MTIFAELKYNLYIGNISYLGAYLQSLLKRGGDMVKKREYVCKVLLYIAIILFFLLMIIVEIKK